MARFRSICNTLEVLFFLIFSAWSLGNRGSEAKDTLLAGEKLRDGENLVSAHKLFEVKFINLENSQNRYLAILYLFGYDGRAVWIANRDNPLMDSSGVLSINRKGNLVLTSGKGNSTIINSEEPAMGGNTSATILDSGNLILRDGERILWQSSDYLSDYTLYLQNDTTLGTETTREKGRQLLDFGHSAKRKLWLQITVLVLIIMSAFLIAFIICRLKSRYCDSGGNNEKNEENDTASSRLQLNKFSDIEAAYKNNNASEQKLCGNKDSELPLFSFSSIESATNNFSTTNKLGEGGFGPVYKGKLVGGQEIAVKRLSKMSRQGLEQFKNEFTLICKLQHRNLVRLLGCCIEGDELILIYEYMPNKGLDSFLFDPMKRALLDWRTRVSIIEGIAQGLLYLHKYSRLKIIHRDLKTSNVLLDCDMNPKISDFGTARVFGQNESQANTSRIIGTFGYMSPEYAMDGLFSEKSDVFSFGVMMLEIVSGRKNNGFYQTDSDLNLLGYAWDLRNQEKILELMDSTLVDSCSTNEFEFIRYVHVGFLCVQQSAADRPTMSEVVSMLSNETTSLPSPKQPAFTIGKSNIGVESSLSTGQESVNDVTISVMNGR
ncbi:G-type lectin S-receptor-like serine/threonine-protein kinase At1g67520 [Telopea speciosissima]|uniref:G-type lectin S-receptor-like serine/threonine-protein kinase At1g67520 n=1 Tax=Telopea speciosissima TaxID=54955 RepID=UPI001CC7951B|nr:G-type lectin S-receptor-like serine/threonine-protein kinase At1g67520 [Telopea speciosissima]